MGMVLVTRSGQPTTPLGADCRHVEGGHLAATRLFQPDGDQCSHLLQFQSVQFLIPLEESEALADDLDLRQEVTIPDLPEDEAFEIGWQDYIHRRALPSP
jgi:hypothetical protein